MVCFQTKNPNLGKFWRALEWKMSIYFIAIWNILRTFGKCYDHLVHFVLIWYIFSGVGITRQQNLATLHCGFPDFLRIFFCIFSQRAEKSAKNVSF
jgi:hypothetical protein